MVDENTEEHWRIAVYRDKLRRSLAARFYLRFHVSLILGAAILGGWIFDIALLRAGMTSIGWRLSLAVLAAYGVFTLGVWMWLRYSGIGEYVKRTKAEALVGDGVDMPGFPKPIDLPDPSYLILGGDGCLLALGILFVVFVLFFALGGYAFMAADAIFADIVIEMLLAAGLLRGVRRMQRSGWFASLWKNTWPSLVFSLLVAVCLGAFARHWAPHAATLKELWITVHTPKALR